MQQRDITTVIEQIKKEVPEEYEFRGKLFNNLDAVINSFDYKPSQSDTCVLMNFLSLTLGYYLDSADTPWKQRIADIMAGRV